MTQRSRSGLTMLFRYSVGTYQGNELTRNPSTDPCVKIGISVHKLIFTLKKKRKRGLNRQASTPLPPPNPCGREKANTTTTKLETFKGMGWGRGGGGHVYTGIIFCSKTVLITCSLRCGTTDAEIPCAETPDLSKFSL